MPTKYFSKKKQEWVCYYKPRTGPRTRAKVPRVAIRRDIENLLFDMNEENLKTILALVKALPHDQPKLGRKFKEYDPNQKVEPPKPKSKSTKASSEVSVEASTNSETSNV